MVMFRRVRQRSSRKRLNLALQGGGAHGAITWGVLDRLLDSRTLSFDAISGSSAGAINAVLLANGLLAGGVDGAKASLALFWEAVARGSPNNMAPFDLLDVTSAGQGIALDLMTCVLSPYMFNPLGYDPMRIWLGEIVDFEALRHHSPLDIYVTAIEVASGKPRVFRTDELSVDVVLASACLPHLHHATKVGDRHYWDGGYAANPAIMPLIREKGAKDTLIVQIIGMDCAELPTQAPDIADRLGRFTFSEPLRREIELIQQCRMLADEGARWMTGRRQRCFRTHRFHHIDGTPATQDLHPGSRFLPERRLIAQLHDDGWSAADSWLDENLQALGLQSTVDLEEAFL